MMSVITESLAEQDAERVRLAVVEEMRKSLGFAQEELQTAPYERGQLEDATGHVFEAAELARVLREKVGLGEQTPPSDEAADGEDAD